VAEEFNNGPELFNGAHYCFDWQRAAFCPNCGAGPDEGFSRELDPGAGRNGEDLLRVVCDACGTYFGTLDNDTGADYEDLDFEEDFLLGYWGNWGQHEPEEPQISGGRLIPGFQPAFGNFKDLINHYEKSPTPAGYENGHTPMSRPPIMHVVFDADDTIWHVFPWGIISSCDEGTFRRISEDVIECQHYHHSTNKKLFLRRQKENRGTAQVALFYTMRDTISALKERGIGMSMASCNDRQPVVRALEAFGILQDFTMVEASMGKPKMEMIEDIAQVTGILPQHILFIDDAYYNIEDVRLFTGAQTLWMGVQIHEPYDIIAVIDGANR